MSTVTNTFLTGAAIGNREDLSNIIYRIDPVDTPFLSGVARETATAVNHEWQTQALAAASTTNYQPEGDDLLNGMALDQVTPTVRLGNIAQISSKKAAVSNTQQAVVHAGRANEMDYAVMLKGLELKRDMETTLCGVNQAKSSSDPRKLACVQSWIKTNTSKAGSDPAAADGTGTRTDGTQRAFTENQLKTVLNAIWTAGGKPNTIMTGAFNKQAFSTFTGRSTPIEQASSKKIVAAVDAYESDFGRLKVVPNRFQRSRDVLVLEMEKWAVAFLKGRNMTSIPLATTGDSQKRMVVSEYTLVARNEKSSGGVFDLTTS
jgi:hypothetical protein